MLPPSFLGEEVAIGEEEEIKCKQEEIKLETDYKAAREITLMYEQEENLGSASRRSDPALSKMSVEAGSFESIRRWLEDSSLHVSAKQRGIGQV